jgi:mono/diheme cytochrome c family protein
MKKSLLVFVMIITVVVFSNCHSSKKAMAETKVTYENSMQTLVMDNCAPCHIPAKGGNKKAFDSYTAVKDNIDNIIHRIELHPGERGFMPFKRDRLSDSTIAVFKQWKEVGMPQ